MSMDNKTENDVLLMLLTGVDPDYRTDETQYIALITGSAPDEATPMANECTYTGYARVAMTKATGWTDGGGKLHKRSCCDIRRKIRCGCCPNCDILCCCRFCFWSGDFLHNRRTFNTISDYTEYSTYFCNRRP